MSVKELDANELRELSRSKKTALIDFFAEWCGPCRMVSPIIDEIAEERGDISVYKVNVDTSPELAESFGVVSIPTLVVIKNGTVAGKSVGAIPKEQILSML